MPKVFISYRRDDTGGEAARLADELGEEFGRSHVFIDIDSIRPAENFEARIQVALQACQVVFVLIGKRWLTAELPNGTRRLDAEGDYVRQEIAAALGRLDVVLVPVLVEGAQMPSPEDLPSDIATLTKLNAVELSNRRWDADMGLLRAIAQSHDKPWRRALAWMRARRGALSILVTGAVVAAAVLVTTRSDRPPQNKPLLPAAVPPKVDLCAKQLKVAVDGTVAPLKCSASTLNSQAWQYFANGNLLVLSAGPDATPGRVRQAICSDLQGNSSTTIPKETQAYQLATLYYGWDFALELDPARLGC
jgi:hypothetical protein